MWLRQKFELSDAHLKLPTLLVTSSGSVPASTAALAAARAIAGGTSMWLAYLQQQQRGCQSLRSSAASETRRRTRAAVLVCCQVPCSYVGTTSTTGCACTCHFSLTQ